MKIKSIIICLLLLSSNAIAQEMLQGIVKGKDEKGSITPLPYATVHWSGTTYGTVTNEAGKFQLNVTGQLPQQLVISFVGFIADTILISSTEFVTVQLNSTIALKQAEVVKKRDASTVSTIKPLNTNTVGQKELLKAACCNLSESFENDPTVEVNYSDAVTGVKEIKMLGLSGIYTQMLTENIPAMRGLAAPYGLTYIPGPWMESIQITKGTGSVVNGYESLTGSINVEFKKPEELEHRWHLDLFASDEARFEMNAYNATKINEKWSTMTLVHGDYNQYKLDANHDSFLDIPLVKQINAYSRWRYHSGKKLEGQFGLKVLSEQRDGGQVDFNKATDYGTTNHYGMQVKNKRAELYTKTGLVFPEKPYKSMGLQTNWVYHDMKSFIGLRDYDAVQRSIYANYIYQSIIGNTIHKWKAGASFILDNYNEHYDEPSRGYQRYITYLVPGVYAEYTFEPNEKFTMIAGAREDYNNYYGWFFTPRLHARYNFTPELIVRGTIGKSNRTANVISDNFGMLASSKVLMINSDLKQEEGWNMGLNLTWKFHIAHREASFNTDVYRTAFVNQVMFDAYSNNNFINVYNLDGQSYSQNVQLSLDYELISNLNIRLAYKWDEVKVTYNGTLENKPLTARNKALLNVGYTFGNEKWRVNFTTQWDGQKPYPQNYLYEPGAETVNHSPDYFLMNAQITKVFRKFELYLGCENITGYTQKNPIINAENPFSNTFDATNIWGPITGRKIYAGFRMNIK